jgi:hypothetical protein
MQFHSTQLGKCAELPASLFVRLSSSASYPQRYVRQEFYQFLLRDYGCRYNDTINPYQNMLLYV